MKDRCLFMSLLFALCASAGVSQDRPPKPIKSIYYLESWTGQPKKPDQTDHKPVGKGNGEHFDLTFRQSINSPTTDVAYLTCNTQPPTGVATTYCKLSVAVLPAE
jgi:hypothetical protein